MPIGIDLGTTHSLIAVFQDGAPKLIPNASGKVLTPSIVALHKGALVVGDSAAAIALSAPQDSAAMFKRAMGTDRVYRLGGAEYLAPELSAMILQSLKRDAEAFLGQAVTDVVISVPAYFNELQRKAVRAAGRIAGLNVLRLINEPTAAALAYGLHSAGQEQRILVFDLGGGTFDISILDLFDGVMEVRASAGDAFLGGEDFTDHLARYIATAAALDAHDTALRPSLIKLAEQVKRALSAQASAAVDSTIGPHSLAMEITRERFDDITAPLLARLAAPIDRALQDAGLTPDDIDKVVLVGGASRMAAARAFAGRKLRQFPVMTLDPDHVVALGAAVQAGLVANDAALDDVVMTDVSAFTLGVGTGEMINGQVRGGYFTPIIERNSTIPISREYSFFTLLPTQEQVVFAIYQGESPLVANNLFLGASSIRVPHTTGQCQEVRCRLTYDVSGLLEVDVTVVSTGRKASLVIDKLAGEMSKEDIAAALKKMARLKVHPAEAAENIHLIARLEGAFAMSYGEARHWVTHSLARFQAALDGQNAAEIAALRQDLHARLDAWEAGHVR